MTQRKRRPQPPKAKKPNLDDLLYPQQFRELNERFYRAHPYCYFRQRLYSLVLAISGRQGDLDTGVEPIVIGALRLTPDVWCEEEQPADYGAIEATVLLHHATEALFRLYFAHAGAPPCPWLEASRRVMGAEHRTRLERLLDSLDTPETRSEVLGVFRGSDTYESSGFTGSEAEWQRATEGLIRLLEAVGRRLLDESRVYNAAKHGLAALAGETGVEFGDPDAPFLSAEGPSLQILDHDSGTGRWSRHNTWVHLDGTIALIDVVIAEIEALFKIARRRYLGEQGVVQLPVIAPEMVDHLAAPSVRADANGVKTLVSTMTIGLAYRVSTDGSRDADRPSQ